MKKKWIDPDDAPRLTGKEIQRPDAQWRIGRKLVSAEDGKAAFRTALRAGKTRVNIHLDNDVIAYFRQKAGERGYQTLINAALRQLLQADRPEPQSASTLQQVEATLQQIQQEMRKLQSVVGQVIPGAHVSRVRIVDWAQTLGDSGTSLRSPATQSSNELTLSELN